MVLPVTAVGQELVPTFQLAEEAFGLVVVLRIRLQGYELKALIVWLTHRFRIGKTDFTSGQEPWNSTESKK